EESDALCIKKSLSGNVTLLEFNYNNQNFQVKIPFSDDASIQHAVKSVMVLLYLNYDKQSIESRMQMLYQIEMRLKIKNGINNTTIIDDSYISDFQSLKIALDFLEQQKQHTDKIVIFSDILQSGENQNDLYQKIATLFRQNNISKIIGIGKNISEN